MAGQNGLIDRDYERFSIFVAATLRVRGSSCAVTIRNISRSGALLQSRDLLQEGEAVELARGRLNVSGKVVWSSSRHFAVRFDEGVHVEDWLAPPRNPAQQLADQMFAQHVHAAPRLRSEEVVPPLPIAEDLRLAEVIDLLRTMSNRLAEDPHVVARHGAALQSADQALYLLKQMMKN